MELFPVGLFLKQLFLRHLSIDLANMHGHLSGTTVIWAASLGVDGCIFLILPGSALKVVIPSGPCNLGAKLQVLFHSPG